MPYPLLPWIIFRCQAVRQALVIAALSDSLPSALLSEVGMQCGDGHCNSEEATDLVVHHSCVRSKLRQRSRNPAKPTRSDRDQYQIQQAKADAAILLMARQNADPA